MSYYLECVQCLEPLWQRHLPITMMAGHLTVQCPVCDYPNQVRLLENGHIVRVDSGYDQEKNRDPE